MGNNTMIYRVRSCSAVPLILVLALVVVAVGFGPLLGGKKSPEKAKIKSLGKDKNVAELLWVSQQCIHANEVVEDSDCSFPEKNASNKNDIFGKLLAESKVKKNQSFLLSTVVDSSLLDCRRKKNVLFLLSGDDNVPSVKYARHYARRDLIQSVGTSPAQSPAAIAPTPVPASSTSRFPRSTNRANPPSPPFTLGDFSDSTWQSTSGDKYASDVQSNKEENAYEAVVIPVILTAVATFVVSALLVVGYCKLCSSSGKGRNDERPLLSLSLSDLSAASSRKSLTLNSSSVRENHSNEPLHDINSSYNAKTRDFCLQPHSMGDWKTNNPVGTATEAHLKPADNLTVTKLDTCGLLPLKPPPGRRSSLIPTFNPGKTAPSLSLPSPLPPPPIGGVSVTPPKPLLPGLKLPRSSPIGSSNTSTSTKIEGDAADAPKAKLKPFFWDKVLTNPDHSMVWHQIKSGSFQFNEEMIETLFGNALARKNHGQQKGSSSQDPSSLYVQIIDTKKSQNLSILLKALNVTAEEVCDALQEGYELPSELIQSLLKMAPTTDEELKLRLYSGDLSRLGPVERFLKVFVDIPFAFRRLELLLFMCTLQEEETLVKESLSILEAACMELRKSRLFLKLLEAVLKTGNRMNDGTYRGGARAFKLDTLLKLSDVKGLDGKTTLLHFVVQEIIRSEGVRAARENWSMSSIDSDDLLEDTTSYDTKDHYGSIGLQAVSGLGNELENVKRAAVLDADSLTGTVSKLVDSLIKARDFLNSGMKDVGEKNGFYQTLRSFVQNAEVDIRCLLEEEERIMALVKKTGDYFHGSYAKDEGLRLFVIVNDFLIVLKRVCKGLSTTTRNPTGPLKKEDMKTFHPEPQQSPSPDVRQQIFPAIKNSWLDGSSSDDENPQVMNHMPSTVDLCLFEKSSC